MSEANLWGRVRGGLSPHGHLQRVEVGLLIGPGIPDFEYCFYGDSGWIELKVAVLPVRASTVVFKSQRGLDPEQIEWLVYRRRCGGRAWVLMQVGKWLLLIDGAHAPKINHLTFFELSAIAFWKRSGSMREADWQALVDGLRSEMRYAIL